MKPGSNRSGDRRGAVAPVMACAVSLVAQTSGAIADQTCRVALALALDVSGSVDGTEYRLQLDGLAAALLDAEVQNAFFVLPEAEVLIFVYEWAGTGSQRRIIDWLPIRSAGDLEHVAGVLRERPRFVLAPSTALGEALQYGSRALSERQECWRRVLDVSGDGLSNSGTMPGEIAPEALGDITVNGLVVGTIDGPNDVAPELETVLDYYLTEVIRGPGAFAMVADSYADFETAMERKLLRELADVAMMTSNE